jgi:hypothetical protein
MLKFTTNDFDYQKDTKTFCNESSTLDLPARNWNGYTKTPIEKVVEITNPKTGVAVIFNFTHADITRDDEVAGWNYESRTGINLLIIND